MVQHPIYLGEPFHLCCSLFWELLFLEIFHLTQSRICLVQAEVGTMPMVYFQSIHVQTSLPIIWKKFKSKLEKEGY